MSIFLHLHECDVRPCMVGFVKILVCSPVSKLIKSTGRLLLFPIDQQNVSAA